ncbi:S8 family serine peptidase [Candidatus Nitrotoga sp. 1052]|uniref:S8 family serine peptidase n=1 Tax=Candidatus Nitrotoga sp. 1052 TaxID=2886964 RepID=UPI001EF562C6|nr:S8 family serine peptidase [Candidatus Nitrotoga sp. 1052]CAH1082206.1 Peptidase S8 [Candidatus Nitrotoga sp. 1052]
MKINFLQITMCILGLLVAVAFVGNLSAADLVDVEIRGVDKILNQSGIENSLTERMKAASPAPQLEKALSNDAKNIDNSVLNNVQVTGLIVSFRSMEAKLLSRNNLPPPQELIEEICRLSGIPLEFNRAMSLDRFVFRFSKPLTWAEAEIIVNRVRQSVNVESVEADTRVHHSMIPNDTYAPDQWNLKSSAAFPGSADLGRAWDITVGLLDTVVAVVDTGVRPNSEFAPRLLPGYDFISDPLSSNDGDGRDNNALDPGDWTQAGECGPGSTAESSSWHGTHVTGIIASTGNNSAGIAGINWMTRILPVRVLGKCGGDRSDIIDGMLWAAGIAVPGVPTNPHPAQIINMSLGGFSPGGCSGTVYPEAINQIKAKGALIIVAAGNSDSDAANYVPASCAGVTTVGAVGPYGYRASYSNYSSEYKVDISAPGGDIASYGIWAGILSTVNSGKTVPESGAVDYEQGTSMAAPHVSGVASLALALDSQIAPELLILSMIYGSRAFPSDSKCTTSYPLCGWGVLDAYSTLQVVNAFKPFSLVYEYYNVDLNHYFRTGSRSESFSVLSGGAGAGWRDTKGYFLAWRQASEGAVPVCRFYGTPGKGPNSHFYTADPGECSQVKNDPGWTYEGIAFYVKLPVNNTCPVDTIPIYRLYNNRWMYNDSNHRFTADITEVNAMTLKNWVSEGLVMCGAGG